MSERSVTVATLCARAQGVEQMKEPEEVAAVLRLHAVDWGSRRIARELGISRTTVKRYLAQGGWAAYPPVRSGWGGWTGWGTG